MNAFSQSMRDAERAFRQARTPRVRQSKLMQAMKAIERAMDGAGDVTRDELADIHQALSQLRDGSLSFSEWRAKVADQITSLMADLAITTEADEEAIFVLMAA